MFKGSMTALITPFTNGEVDAAAYQAFVEWQISQGSHGLVPCGTTGESPTLSHEEHKQVVELCIEAAAGRVPVVAGAGSNSTDEAVDLAKHAKSAGADGILVVSPSYIKPSQEGLFRHFEAVNNAVEIPMIVYNIPPRSVVDILPETMARIAGLANVVGVKDATNDLARPLRERNLIGPDWCMLSGEDGTTVAYLAGIGAGTGFGSWQVMLPFITLTGLTLLVDAPQAAADDEFVFLRWPLLVRAVCAGLFIAACFFGGAASTPFIYFQF